MSHDSKIDVSAVSKVKLSTPHQSIENLNSHMLRVLDSSKKQNNSAQITSSATHDLSKPHENDVFLGRGGRGTPTSTHSGNINYRFIIKSYKEHYKSRRNKTEKHSVTKEVFHIIRNQSPPCCFILFFSLFFVFFWEHEIQNQRPNQNENQIWNYMINKSQIKK